MFKNQSKSLKSNYLLIFELLFLGELGFELTKTVARFARNVSNMRLLWVIFKHCVSNKILFWRRESDIKRNFTTK